MKLAVFAFSLATLCAPGIALAQNSTAPTDITPPPSADCTTADCNTSRNQQDNLNNGSGTPGAQDSLGSDSGNTSGSGTLPPTTPDRTLEGGDRGLGGGNGGGLGGSGSLGGGSSSSGSGL